MLFALLYDRTDRLIAAAPACEQQPLGTIYWYDCQHVDFTTLADCETAYVEIQDEVLCQQLLEIQFGRGLNDGDRAAAAVDRYSSREQQLERISPRAAA